MASNLRISIQSIPEPERYRGWASSSQQVRTLLTEIIYQILKVFNRSTAPNSLYTWAHNMRHIQFFQSFQPEGCPSAATYPAVKLVAGEVWGDIYQQALLHLTAVGPIPASVGVSGHLNGGDHSPISNQVTGDILTANEYQHGDIFWALRGISLPFLSYLSLVLKPSLTCYFSRAVARLLALLLP